MIETVTNSPVLANEVGNAREEVRRRVRVVLREMSEQDWSMFKESMQRTFSHPTKVPDIGVLELVFRIGESISNVEIAALAKADKVSGRRLVDPEVARRNALIKAKIPGAAQVDPEAAYAAAQKALQTAKATLARAEHTLAYPLVEPTTPYKHARNTIFRLVDAIIDHQWLMSILITIENDLAAVPPITREQIRWALHRMPIKDRMCVIGLIPLNTILMLQDGEDPNSRATRNRKLAFDLFVESSSEEELMTTYQCSLPALKSAVAAILDTLVNRPLARKRVHEYLAQVQKIEPMGTDDVRRSMKRLTPEQRAEILSRIPPCAWKVRDVMPLHKRLFFDYLSGEWVLDALVAHHNLRGNERLTGTFKREGTLTVRGAGAAIDGVLSKIAEEPDLRQLLRDWATGRSADLSPQERQTGTAVETDRNASDSLNVPAG